MKKISKQKLLQKIEEAALVGRGGAAFPVALKWRAVKEEIDKKKTSSAYIVANGAEGEPGVRKDGNILIKESQDFVLGLNLALNFLGVNKVERVYLFLNKDYFSKTKKEVLKVLASDKCYLNLSKKIEFFLKPEGSGYIGGEESAILNIIEGKRTEPRYRPPYPTTSGLFNQATLVNNIETFLDVALAAKNQYRGERLFTISGFVKKPGVYRFPALMSINEVLRKSGNYPNSDFFVQIGGNVSGEILNSQQLDIPVESAASIMVYDRKRTEEKKLFSYWLKFYFNNSCGQCTTCREGTYRLLEMFSSSNYNEKEFWDLVFALDDNSFCALGSSLPIPLVSYYRNMKNIDPLLNC